MARIEIESFEFAAYGHPASVILAFDPDTNSTHAIKVRREFAFSTANRITNSWGWQIIANEKVPG